MRMLMKDLTAKVMQRPSNSRPVLRSGAILLAALCSPLASAQDPQQGKAVYEKWCSPCHAPGPGHPGTQSLQLKYNDSLPSVLEERSDLGADAIRTFVRQGVLMMAPFRKTEIDDANLDALVAYLAK